MAYTIAALAVVVALIFWWTQKQTKRQKEWRRQKELDIEVKRARLAAREKAEKNTETEEK